MDHAVIRFPVKTLRRIKNRRGKRSVSCIVSDRWLKFDETAQWVDFGAGERGAACFVHVMTDAGNSSRKICEVCVLLEDLKAVLDNTVVVNGKP